jgi:hypothetical protein
MKAFEFPLRQALAWRRTQLETEENKLRQLAAKAEELRLAVVKLDLVKGQAESTVRTGTAIDAVDLWAWAAYRQRLLAELRALAGRQRECEQQMAAQCERTREAQRQCRLLEKLEERRRAAWRIEADREMESLAAESFLALWNRQAR